jgi:hypothetical protein
MTTPTSYMSKLLCLQEQTGPPIFSLDPKGPEVKMANWFFYYFFVFSKIYAHDQNFQKCTITAV